MTFAERVLQRRRQKDLTQSELAKQTGLHQVTICRLERNKGKQTVPLNSAFQLARVLKFSLDELMEQKDN